MNTAINVTPAIPEIVVFVMACVILVVDLYAAKEHRVISYALTLTTLGVAMLISLYSFSADPVYTFNNMFIDDALSDVIKIAVCGITFLVLIYAREYIELRGLYQGEYFVLVLFAVVGMMVMASANHFLVLYLGLELLSLCLYSLVAFQRDSALATEAAMKYFVLGALGSGMMLYGMSILYGLTGTLDITEVRQAVGAMPLDNVALIFGLVFVLVSLAFKLGAVPFHMWVPDVYHGASTSSTVFIGTAPKIAGFAIVIRLLIGGLEDLHGAWRDMVIILSLLSIAIGNLIAIAQSNLKRMLAYSAISHMGFMLLGVLAGTPNGYSAALFYILAYALMSLGGFGMIIVLSRAGFEADELADLKGLNQRNPWYALLMMLLMVSMAGIPPTIGFFAKLSVIQAIIEVNLVWLAVVAVLFAVVGAYYYLRVIKLMYFDPPDEGVASIEAAPDLRVVMGLNAWAMVLLLPWIGPIQRVCLTAVASVMNGFAS